MTFVVIPGDDTADRKDDSTVTLDDKVFFDHFLRCLDREENLIHYRMSWGLQWNGACILGVYWLHTALPAYTIAYLPMALLAILGVVVSMISHLGVVAAHAQASYLIKALERRLKIKKHDWSASAFIRPFGEPDTVHRSARRGSFFMPLAFALFWSVILVYALSHFSTIDWKKEPTSSVSLVLGQSK